MGLKMFVVNVAALVFLLAPEVAIGDDLNEDARIQFEQGKTFFNEGKYEQAAIALERANELRPGHKILYYLGMAESENGNYVRALEAYDRYMEEAEGKDSPEKIEEVQAEIKRLNAMVGAIIINCNTANAKVKVDKETRGTTPLKGPIIVNVGRHEIVVKKGQEELLQEVVRVAGGQEIVLQVEAEAQSPKPPGDTTTPAAKEAEKNTPPESKEAPDKKKWKQRKSPRIWTWVTFGMGGAAAIGAVVTGALALKKDNEVWDQCGDDTCFSYQYDGNFEDDSNKVDTLALTTDILIGVGAAFIVTGTLLYFFEPDYAKESAVTAHPTVLQQGAGLTVTGRF